MATKDGAEPHDDALLIALQLRLKKPKGAEPKREHVAAAVTLAQDPTLEPAAVWKAALVPAGGTRTRIIEYRNRIVSEGLLTAAAGDQPQRPLSSALVERLLVQQHWVDKHAPSLRELTCGPLIFSGDGAHATRTITARVDGQDESVSCGTPRQTEPLPCREQRACRTDVLK